MSRSTSLLLLMLIGLGALAGCSRNGGLATAPRPPQDGYGSIAMHLTDAPAALDHIYLDVNEVWVHRVNDGSPGDTLPAWNDRGHGGADGKGKHPRGSDCERDEDGAWFRLDATAGVYDLLDLRNGVFAVLATGQVPAGTYDQVRLKLGPDNSIVVDGATHPLVVPSGQTSGYKLKGRFTVPEAGGVDVGIDFDACRSVHRTGNGKWMLKPVARIHAMDTTGGIAGQVVPASVPTWVFVVQGPDTLTSALTGDDGRFAASLLPPGTYTLELSPTVAGYEPMSVAGVAVVAGQVTDVGTLTLTGPAPTTGRVVGQVNPATFTTRVYALAGGAFVDSTDTAASGAFEIALAPGSYTMRFSPSSPDYVSVDVDDVVVAEDQTTDLGTVSLPMIGAAALR